MVTTILRKLSYGGTFLYILQYNYTFQYLFAWNNEVYRQEIIVKPGITSWRRWLWLLGLKANPYTQKQIEESEKIMISGAVKSIDLLKQDPHGNQRREAEAKARENRTVEKTDCQWQARADENGDPIFLCLNHDKTAPLEDNPKHS